jgi:hypothetical protein
VNIDLNNKDREVLRAEMSVYGYTFTEKGTALICSGPQTTFILNLIETGEGRITGIKMSLHPLKYKATTYRFGEKSQLTLHEDNTASWTFY